MLNNNLIKPLCLSFRTPPDLRPQAILIGKMIPEWLKQGLKPVILTYQKARAWHIEAPIYQIPAFKISRFLNKIPPVKRILRQKYYLKTVSQVSKVIKEFIVCYYKHFI